MKNAANGHEWAQCSYQQMLPIPLDTPIIAAEKCCQCLRMGPVFLGRIVANTFGWAHYCCRKILPMVTNVPVFPYQNLLPMPENGPIIMRK